MSHALRPSVLDELGLVAAVQTLLRGMEETRGMKTGLRGPRGGEPPGR